MPGMSGTELARRIRVKRPSLPLMFITGFADRSALEGIGDNQIIGKPFVNGELAEKVQHVLTDAIAEERASP